MTQIMPADLRALTTLRFLAAIWVVAFAAWPHMDVSLVPVLATKGYLGVEVFFVLSGFILSHVYLQAFGEKTYSHKGFLWARIARVYPLHLITLFGMLALGVAAGFAGMQVADGLTDWRSLPAHLTLTQAWGLAPMAAFNHPSWSVSAEWFAYLTFPLYAFVAWRLRERPMLAIAAASAGLIAIYVAFEALAGFPLTRATFQWGALRIVPCFALGVAVYLMHRKGVARPGLVALVGAAGLIGWAAFGLWDAVTVLFAGMMILGLGGVSNDKAGVLSSPFGVWLGEISYAVYMACAPVLLVGVNVMARLTGDADGKLNPLLMIPVVLAIPVVAAALHHLIERPARRILRQWADRRHKAKGATMARTDSPDTGLHPTKPIV